jgi:hypothetical protein
MNMEWQTIKTLTRTHACKSRMNHFPRILLQRKTFILFTILFYDGPFGNTRWDTQTHGLYVSELTDVLADVVEPVIQSNWSIAVRLKIYRHAPLQAQSNRIYMLQSKRGHVIWSRQLYWENYLVPATIWRLTFVFLFSLRMLKRCCVKIS